MEREISYEYIRGLAEGEGTFTFSPNKTTGKLTPTFAIRMHERDEKLLTLIRDKLKLNNKIYRYHHLKNDGYKRGPTVTLIVREIGNLKNIIVPLFYKKLIGNKAVQFEKWMDLIENDPRISSNYKFISHLYNCGYYENVHHFD